MIEPHFPEDAIAVTGPSPIAGSLRMPGDKSISHRALMLGALSPDVSTIRGLSNGADVQHTLGAIQSLGASAEIEPDGTVHIRGGALRVSEEPIDVGNSGTGIRLLMGIAAGLPFSTILDGDESIRRRPMERVAAPLRQMGAQVDGPSGGGFAPLTVRGASLQGIDYTTPVASAQVKSAILLAGLSAQGPTIVREPAASRRHTEEMLAALGADIEIEGTTTTLRPSILGALDEDVPGDPSQAAFWLVGAAGRPGSDVTVVDIYLGAARDGFIDVLLRMGANLEVIGTRGSSNTVRVIGTQLHGTEIAPSDIPGLVDEIPILAIAAALADGTTTVRGASELRVKESDRLATTAAMLAAFGVPVVEHADGLDITGGAPMHPAKITSHGDHRIAMAAAIGALSVAGTTQIAGFGAVATSYPAFLDDLVRCSSNVSIDDDC